MEVANLYLKVLNLIGCRCGVSCLGRGRFFGVLFGIDAMCCSTRCSVDWVQLGWLMNQAHQRVAWRVDARFCSRMSNRTTPLVVGYYLLEIQCCLQGYPKMRLFCPRPPQWDIWQCPVESLWTLPLHHSVIGPWNKHLKLFNGIFCKF